MKQAEKKAATAATAAMKSDGIAPTIQTERGDIEYNRKAREAMLARMTPDVLCNALKASRKKSKGKK